MSKNWVNTSINMLNIEDFLQSNEMQKKALRGNQEQLHKLMKQKAELNYKAAVDGSLILSCSYTCAEHLLMAWLSIKECNPFNSNDIEVISIAAQIKEAVFNESLKSNTAGSCISEADDIICLYKKAFDLKSNPLHGEKSIDHLLLKLDYFAEILNFKQTSNDRVVVEDMCKEVILTCKSILKSKKDVEALRVLKKCESILGDKSKSCQLSVSSIFLSTTHGKTLSLIMDMIAGYKKEQRNIDAAVDIMIKDPDLQKAHLFVAAGNNKSFSSAYLFSKTAPSLVLEVNDPETTRVNSKNKSKSSFWFVILEILPEINTVLSSLNREKFLDQVMNKPHELPEFSFENIQQKLNVKIKGSSLPLIDLIDDLFLKLNGNFLSNQPEGFSKKIIYKGGLIDKSKPSKHFIETLNNLRKVARLLCPSNRQDDVSILNSILLSADKWISIDENSFKIKTLSSDSICIDIHKDLAFKLNIILAIKTPDIIKLK